MRTPFTFMSILLCAAVLLSGCAVRVTAAPAVSIRVQSLALATDKDDCKRGGWRELRTAEFEEFDNQGQCVSYVARD